MTPTTEQCAILHAAGTGNLVIEALAGTGKTTMLRMIERAVPDRPILYLAFNRRVVNDACYASRAKPDEAERRMLSTTTVATFNSIGHRIWAAACGRNLTLNKRKSGDILTALIEASPRALRAHMWGTFHAVTQGVAIAKAIGYVPPNIAFGTPLAKAEDLHAVMEEEPDMVTLDLINAVLTRSIKAAYDGLIDFNDQVYMPAVFGGAFPRYPLVMVDELQDLNAVNHAMLRKLVTGRFIGVGDPHQNIYGFRGAVPQGMANAKTDYRAIRMGLTVSFRCPSAIVQNAQWHAPHFKWNREGGSIYTVKDDLPPEDVADGDAIICRNNAPLFRLAFHLMANGRSVDVAGSDIDHRLTAILTKLGPASMPRLHVLDAIQDWQDARMARRSTTAEDMAECLRIFARQSPTLSGAIAYAQQLFRQTGPIRLLTGHKAKGLEFPSVYFLDPWLIRTAGQDLNLRYVIETRSQDRLTYVNSSNIPGLSTSDHDRQQVPLSV